MLLIIGVTPISPSRGIISRVTRPNWLLSPMGLQARIFLDGPRRGWEGSLGARVFVPRVQV